MKYRQTSIVHSIYSRRRMTFVLSRRASVKVSCPTAGAAAVAATGATN